jgi:8-hydroxy-5-deazaflavin:NADPH oxidoreductase
MRISIIGAGNMGRGIATRAVAGGNEVPLLDPDEMLARTLADDLGSAASAVDEVTGEIVVLALPYEAVAPAIERHRDALVGKVVVDIVNPLDWSSMDRVVTPAGSSSAEETAKRVPDGAKVVKAFNTTFAKALVAGEVAGHQLAVLIAGDDADAKAKVADLAAAGGMRSIDVGPLARARMLEQLGLFHIAIQQQIGGGFASALDLYW